jgi:hypothetical protein
VIERKKGMTKKGMTRKKNDKKAMTKKMKNEDAADRRGDVSTA